MILIIIIYDLKPNINMTEIIILQRAKLLNLPKIKYYEKNYHYFLIIYLSYVS